MDTLTHKRHTCLHCVVSDNKLKIFMGWCTNGRHLMQFVKKSEGERQKIECATFLFYGAVRLIVVPHTCEPLMPSVACFRS